MKTPILLVLFAVYVNGVALREEWSFAANFFTYDITANMLATAELATFQFASNDTRTGGSKLYQSDACEHADGYTITQSGNLYFSCFRRWGMLNPSGIQTHSFLAPQYYSARRFLVGKVLAIQYLHDLVAHWAVMDLDMKEMHSVENEPRATSVTSGRDVFVFLRANMTHCTLSGRLQDMSLTPVWEALVQFGDCSLYAADEHGTETLYVSGPLGIVKFAMSTGKLLWNIDFSSDSTIRGPLVLVKTRLAKRYFACTLYLGLTCLDSVTGITVASFTAPELRRRFQLKPMLSPEIDGITAIADHLVLSFSWYPLLPPYERRQSLMLVSLPFFNLEYTLKDKELSTYPSKCASQDCLQSRFLFTETLNPTRLTVYSLRNGFLEDGHDNATDIDSGSMVSESL